MTTMIVLQVVAALLVLAGIVGSVLPALPGVPLVFGGLLLSAWADGFNHVGAVTLTILGALALIAVLVDFVAGLAGAKRVGASRLALAGAVVGTVVGFFFGLPGLLIGPFAGALIGEVAAGGTLGRATEVGVGAWLGFIIGSVLKLAICGAMLGVFALAWMTN